MNNPTFYIAAGAFVDAESGLLASGGWLRQSKTQPHRTPRRSELSPGASCSDECLALEADLSVLSKNAECAPNRIIVGV